MVVGGALRTSWVQGRKRLGGQGKENNLLTTQGAAWAKQSPGLSGLGARGLYHWRDFIDHMNWSWSLGPAMP